MVTCTQCDSKNSLDSRFCKGCGKELDRDSVEKAHAGLEDLVSQGFRALNDGHVEEASLIAETALGEDPSSTSALSLKAMCRERDGQIAEALELYEKVLTLKPDSALDKIKVTHLRNQITGKMLSSPPPTDKKTAFVGAIAATVLVVSIGVALAGFIHRDSDKTASKQGASLDQRPFTGLNSNGAQPGTNQTQGNPNAAETQTPDSSAQPQAGNSGTQPGGNIPHITPSGNVGIMPNAGTGLGQIPAVTIVPDRTLDYNAGNQGSGKEPAGDQNSIRNKMAEQGNDSPDPKTITKDAQSSSKGIYEIKFSSGGSSQGGGNSNGGSVGISDDRPADALVRSGLQQYQLGKFQGAAKNFEGALKAGADPGRTNQRLAQCYERLNQNAEAIGAYTKAVAAFESQIKSGRGNTGTAQAGLDSCKAALQVLKGGS